MPRKPRDLRPGFDFGLLISDCGLKEGKMTPQEMKQRTKDYALRIIKLVESLPRGRTVDTIGGPLLRCGTSIAPPR